MFIKLQAGSFVRDCGQDGGSVAIESQRCAARHGEGGMGGQGLNFDKERPGALDRGKHYGPSGTAGPLGEQESRRIVHIDKAALSHFEDPDFICGTKAILYGAEQTKPAISIALEIKNRIHHVLENTRSGDGPFLGDMPHQNCRDARGLRPGHQSRGAFSHLSDAARRGGQFS